MHNDIKKYVQSCDNCQCTKSNTMTPPGLLKPLPIPEGPWTQVSLDFIMQLPKTKKGNDAIMVVVDTFTKMAHFIPTKTSVSAPETAELFFQQIVRLHGIPETIISD